MHTHSLAESAPEKVILEIITYDRLNYNRFVAKDVAEILPQIKKDQVNWVNLDGLSNPAIIEGLQNHFSLHSLLVEDILNDQRPKAEEYEDYLFVTLKMLYRIEGSEVDYEQISFVLGKNYLLTFQEKEGDLFDAFRERIRQDQGRVEHPPGELGVGADAEQVDAYELVDQFRLGERSLAQVDLASRGLEYVDCGRVDALQEQCLHGPTVCLPQPVRARWVGTGDSCQGCGSDILSVSATHRCT